MADTEHPASAIPRLALIIVRQENVLKKKPDDPAAAMKLLTAMDFQFPLSASFGPYSACQYELARQTAGTIDPQGHVSLARAIRHYRDWSNVLDGYDLPLRFAQTQMFFGQNHNIGDKTAQCDLYLKLFGQQAVIPRICHDCYKVQILPLDLAGLVRISFLMRRLKLPRDNARKCMVEMRLDVPFPYKGYIYCQSEEEARTCKEIFDDGLARIGEHSVVSALSHGCSEYSLRYPAWKYSADGSHRDFERSDGWNEAEETFLAENKPPELDRAYVKLKTVTLRDVLVMRSWVDYAELIGDESWRQFRDQPSARIPIPFSKRIGDQAEQRRAEREELRERLAALDVERTAPG